MTMGYYDDYENDHKAEEAKKQKREKARQRKVVRYEDLPDNEIRKQGSELLAKIVKAIPKYFNQQGALAGRWKGGQRKEGIVFANVKVDDKEATQQVLRIGLALRPSVVVDYVVGAFKTKGWGAKHTYNDMEGFDFLDLTLPEDWLKRVLCIGRYCQKVSTEEETKLDIAPTPDIAPIPTE